MQRTATNWDLTVTNKKKTKIMVAQFGFNGDFNQRSIGYTGD
jgi:hypothetical protein